MYMILAIRVKLRMVETCFLSSFWTTTLQTHARHYAATAVIQSIFDKEGEKMEEKAREFVRSSLRR